MSNAFARNSAIEEEAAPYDAGKIARVAAFIVSAHGGDAVQHARRLEAASAVPDMARRVRMEVERLVQAFASAGGMHSASAGFPEGRS